MLLLNILLAFEMQWKSASDKVAVRHHPNESRMRRSHTNDRPKARSNAKGTGQKKKPFHFVILFSSVVAAASRRFRMIRQLYFSSSSLLCYNYTVVCCGRRRHRHRRRERVNIKIDIHVVSLVRCTRQSQSVRRIYTHLH